MSETLILAIVAITITTGVVLQRITGAGFASAAAPALVLSFGPVIGIQVTNALAALCSLILLVPIWRHVQLRRTAVILVAALATTPLGVLLTLALPETALQLLLGLVMLAALLTAGRLGRCRFVGSTAGAALTGALGGVANASVGQAGPLMGAYALASRWELPRYVASMQLCWFFVNAAAAALKGVPPISWVDAAVMCAAVAAGGIAGTFVARVLPPRAAERCLFAVALVGSVIVLGKGLAGLIWLY